MLRWAPPRRETTSRPSLSIYGGQAVAWTQSGKNRCCRNGFLNFENTNQLVCFLGMKPDRSTARDRSLTQPSSRSGAWLHRHERRRSSRGGRR